MTNLKLLGLTALFAPALFLMSCQPNNSNSGAGRCDNRNAAGCAGGSTVTTTSNADIVPQGRLIGNDQNTFQQTAAELVSATVTPNSLGAVSDGQTNDNTGIAFGAKVSISNGKVTTASANTPVVGTSRLLVAVYDSLVGQQATTGQVIGPIEIPMSTATGTVGGGVANVTFNDSYGTIQFQGNYDTNTFTGTMQFTNNSTIGGGGAVSGTFQFQIPTCSFFVCN